MKLRRITARNFKSLRGVFNFEFPASPKMEELKSACVQNPSHQVCQEMEHKKQKAKETRERKLQLKINSVKGINHE